MFLSVCHAKYAGGAISELGFCLPLLPSFQCRLSENSEGSDLPCEQDRLKVKEEIVVVWAKPSFP